MPRNRLAILTFLLLLIVSIADVWVTLHYNPTLTREANPLVSKMGLGPIGLIISNIFIVSMLGIALKLYRNGPRSNNLLRYADPWEDAGLQLYKKAMTKAEFIQATFLFWPLPANWHQFWRITGFYVTWGVITARVVAVFSWVAIWEGKWSSYNKIRHLTYIAGYPCLELFFGLVIGAFMFRYFIRFEFMIEQNQHVVQRS